VKRIEQAVVENPGLTFDLAKTLIERIEILVVEVLCSVALKRRQTFRAMIKTELESRRATSRHPSRPSELLGATCSRN
jgi:hypothetical protein